MKKYILVFLILIGLFSCDKDPKFEPVPSVTTGNVTDLGYTSTTVKYSLSSTLSYVNFGIQYGTNSNFNEASSNYVDFYTSDVSYSYDYRSATISNLTRGVTYYYRAYAKDALGNYIYGNTKSFTTLLNTPTITTNSVTEISQTSAICGGYVLDDGGAAVTSRGVCWNTSAYPTIALSTKTVNGGGVGSFTSSITGLTASTVYYVRAYATSRAGTSYGQQYSFTPGTTNQIGSTYAGGIVFYLDGTGQHGLVCASTDQSTRCQWYNGNYFTTGATASYVGSGLSNTNTIVSLQGSGTYAARLCANLTLNGYSDWYLPSKDELNLIYTNLKQSGLAEFSCSYYWCSTEYSSTNAYQQNFANGSFLSYSKSDLVCGVRAIRSF